MLAGGTLMAPVAAAFAAPPRVQPPALLAMLGSETAVREIGWAYRAAFPAEDDAAVLAALLAVPDTSARVRADFAAGRTVCMAGWVLAVTEARACALYTLRRS